MGNFQNDTVMIERYIVYLITECGLSVTLHPLVKESLISFGSLMRFNIHDNSYCSFIKSTKQGQLHCHAQQKKAMKKCENGDFCGVCYAGVFEYVYPITDGSHIIGFISVSGYPHPTGDSYVTRAAELLGYSKETARKFYGTLKKTVPPKERIDTLITPLCRMLELAYRTHTPTASAEKESLNRRILRYVKQHYYMDITADALCERFHCSRSTFSHTFKKETGRSFRQYLTELRLDYARHLLVYSSLRVGEIAFSIGFNDANYFSNIFKKHEGCSPLEYRRRENKL